LKISLFLESHVRKSEFNMLIDFEHEATYSYARQLVEKDYRKPLQSERSPYVQVYF
jgi:hypothetical protein